MMLQKRKRVTPMEAEIIKSKLESADIPCILKYEAISKLYGLTGGGLGEVRILVPQEFVESAKKLLEENNVNLL